MYKVSVLYFLQTSLLISLGKWGTNENWAIFVAAFYFTWVSILVLSILQNINKNAVSELLEFALI